MALGLFVDIQARFAQFQDSLAQMSHLTEHHAKKMEKAFSLVEKAAAFAGVALGIHEIVEALDRAIETMDELKKASERTGVAVEALSALRYAAKLSGVSFEELQAALVKLNKNLDDGGGAFRRLGIDLKSIKTPEQAFEALAEKISKLEGGFEKTAIAVQALGKKGAALIPLFNLGASGLARLREEAQSLGLIITPEQAEAAEKFKDSMHRLRAAGEGLTLSVANALVPSLQQIVTAMNEAIKRGGLLIGVLRGIAEAGKVALQGGPDPSPLEKQRKFVEGLRKELEKLQQTQRAVRETPTEFSQQQSPRFAGKLGKLTLPSDDKVREQIAGVQESLRASEASLDRMVKTEEEIERLRKARAKFQETSAISQAELKRDLDAAKQAAQQRQQLDDITFARGLTAIKDYYARRLLTTQAELDAELKAVARTLALEREAEELAETPEQAVAHKARIIELEGRQTALRSQRRQAGIVLAEQEKDAEDAFRDSLVQANQSYLEQIGLLEQAAAAELNLQSVRKRQDAIEANIKTGLAKPEDLETFKGLIAEKQARAALAASIHEQDRELQRLDSDEEDANTARLNAGNSFAAELVYLQRVRELRLERIQYLEAEQKAALKAAKDAPEGSPLQRDLYQQADAFGARADAIKAANTGAIAAEQDLQVTMRATSALLREEAFAEQDIENQRLSGRITDQEALAQTDRARLASLAQLRQALERDQELAAKGSIEAQQRVEEERLAIERLGATSDQVGRQMDKLFEDAFIDPFTDLINKTKTADQALKAFFNNIAQALLKLETQKLAQSLFGGLFSNDSASGDKGIFGFLSSLTGIFGSSGASAGATTTSEQAGITQAQYADYYGYPHALGGAFGPRGELQLERFAMGGVARKPMMSIFGEGRLPEAYVPLPDGRSIPVTMSGQASGEATRVQRGPSAITGWQAQRAPALTLQLHPDAMQMTLRDWFEGEMARTLAGR